MELVSMPDGGTHQERLIRPNRQDVVSRDFVDGEVVRSQAGVILPRIARSRAVRASGRPVREHGALGFSVRSFSARSAREQATLDAAFRLRSHVLVHELGWLLPEGDGWECDRCDGVARHFAVLALLDGRLEPTVAGYARVLLPRHRFMLEHEFVELLGGEPLGIDAARAFEISRVVTDPRFRGVRSREGRTVTEYLGRAIAQWALSHARHVCYTVCEARHIRALRLCGLHFAQLGRIVEYQRGVAVCAATLDFTRTATDWRTARPADYAWYLGESSWGPAAWTHQ
jgi:N-acyl-L-homoserine lactone synthetase